ncbi:MAG: HlyC/CorC family transporter [Bacteroidetes bacterium]|nr:HlyC/CorC family transporter [Bacteroidota bacterium]
MIITLVIIISLIFSAFFSGLEIAYLSANKIRFELQSRQGRISAKIVMLFFRNPSYFIGTVLVGNNITLVAYGIAMAELLDGFIGSYFDSPFVLLTVKTIISTIFVLLAAEFIPKALFLINPDRILSALVFPAIMIYIALYPVVYSILFLSRFILKSLLNLKFEEAKPVIGRIDLDHYLKEFLEKRKDKEIDSEVRILHNALAFSDVRLKKCMVPVTGIASVEADEPVENLLGTFTDTGYSRIPVYEKNQSDIIGYIHSYEMFRNPETVRSVLLPLPEFGENMPAKDALTALIRERKSIALVKKEQGEVSGIVTMEDIMEEIFGEIEDEHDR